MPVKFWKPEIVSKLDSEGATLINQTGALGPYPKRLSDRIAHWAEKTPQKTWMAERNEMGTWQHTNYIELQQISTSIGQALLNMGLSLERPLLILSENSISHALMALGAQHAGIPSAAIAPAYCLLSKDFAKLRSIAEQITPGAIFVREIERYKLAIQSVFGDTIPILCETGGGSHIEWADLIKTPTDDRVARANEATGPDTIAKFMFTSGTTGTPKPVIQTQRMLCSNMEMVLDCYAYLRDEPPILVDWAPWNHVASGNKVFNMAIYNGGTYYIDAGKPTPALIGQTIRNLREISPNWYFNVPIGFEMLVAEMERDEGLRKSFFKDLKLLLYAGAAMAGHTWDSLLELSHQTAGENVLLCTGLGSTETAPFALFCTEHQPGPGNVGVPAKGITLKLVPRDGRLEARIKGPNVTPGYWRNAALTQAAFDADGYYCLGDALRYAQSNDPAKGFLFDGRLAENFKLGSGTWVNVAALRKALTDALGGLAQDVVIAGDGRGDLAALIVPAMSQIEQMLPEAGKMSREEMVNHPKIRNLIATSMGQLANKATGSANRVNRAIILSQPLDLDKGEVTDKGSVNQRAVLRHRNDLVEMLYTDSHQVIVAKH